MNDHDLKNLVLHVTGAKAVKSCDLLQELWSGYGAILRCHLDGAAVPSVVVKHVQPPSQVDHPRGWATGTSDQRKRRSYEVESAWYREWASRCDDFCRVPRLLGKDEAGSVLILEDLDVVGFGRRVTHISSTELDACTCWLAEFHATFLDERPTGLWETGTYWHLETRPDELEALEDEPLKQAVRIIDERLRKTRFQTFVHGDAKLDNFCFSSIGESVAAVDFQYTGAGCGMKDLAYFAGSCLDAEACKRQEEHLLDSYFSALDSALKRKQSPHTAQDIETDWRPLYRVAWADFHRFLKAWSPGHWKITDYSEQVCREVVTRSHGW